MSRLCYFPARPCLVILAALALCVEGALDSVKGPREHPDADGITSVQRQLWEAALEGDTKLLNITNLITAGADPNGHNHDHMTALHWAVIKGQRLAVELLIDRGAHTDVRDSSYRTPAHFCAVYGESIARLAQALLVCVTLSCSRRCFRLGRSFSLGSDLPVLCRGEFECR